jgi:hypothetical protein
MKKYAISFILTIIYALNAISQTAVITYQVHALKAGIDNPMSYCSYVAPGSSGENAIWDFSSLSFDQPFTGFLKNSQVSANQALFPKANTELGEFGSLFYFNVNEDQTDQYGYVSADGKTKITYSTPFVKMKYPFKYGDTYSGLLSGTYEYPGNVKGNLSGSYTVEADAFGSLILPGNVRFDNVLRIKTSKTEEIVLSNSVQVVEVSSYRWYNAAHRYPLLSLTEYTSKLGNSVNTNYQAAYNSNAINISNQSNYTVSLGDISLYPNPARTSLYLKAEVVNKGTLNFEICDASGKLIRSFNRQVTETGRSEFNLGPEISGLKPSTYLLIIISGDTDKTLNFTLIN